MTLGLILTSLGLGLRHGVDWDHIAAIADLSAGSDDRRTGFAHSMLYAVGHALVVALIGALVIVFGATLPDGVDAWAGRIAGASLVLLGAWLLWDLLRNGREFRLRSRWMLVLRGTFAGVRRVVGRQDRRIVVEHEHPHEHVDGVPHDHTVAHDHAHLDTGVGVEVDAPAPVATGRWTAPDRPHTHGHRHRHELRVADQAAGYGRGTAVGVGMLHGVGIESPTQIAVFVASTTAVGTGAGLTLLAAWCVGLIGANAGLALLAGAGMLDPARHGRAYLVLGAVIAGLSLAVGAALLLEIDLFPAINL